MKSHLGLLGMTLILHILSVGLSVSCKKRDFNARLKSQPPESGESIPKGKVDVDRLVELYLKEDVESIKKEFHDPEIRTIVRIYETHPRFAPLSGFLKSRIEAGKAMAGTDYPVERFVNYTMDFACVSANTHALGSSKESEIRCLMPEEKSQEWATRKRAMHMVSHYPRIVTIPTFAELSVQDFNRSAHLPILFLGLTTVEKQRIDGVEVTPWTFFEHDINHGGEILYGMNDLFPSWRTLPTASDSLSSQLERDDFMSRIQDRHAYYTRFYACLESFKARESTTKDQREALDLVVFNIVHESRLTGAGRTSSESLRAGLKDMASKQTVHNESLERLFDGHPTYQKYQMKKRRPLLESAVIEINTCLEKGAGINSNENFIR